MNKNIIYIEDTTEEVVVKLVTSDNYMDKVFNF